MPETEVVMFSEEDGSSPLMDWLDTLPQKVQDKCIARIERLAERGYELRRPEADLLRDGVYELRLGFQGVNYRMLYFFHKQRAVMSHGLTKERRVPDTQIDRAVERKARFAADPDRHTHEG